jgi:hypothetical protein
MSRQPTDRHPRWREANKRSTVVGCRCRRPRHNSNLTEALHKLTDTPAKALADSKVLDRDSVLWYRLDPSEKLQNFVVTHNR